MTRAMSDTTAPAAPAPAVEMDELEKYRQRPQLAVSDGFKVLGWWRAHKGIYLSLVKMVREVLACPLSSAAWRGTSFQWRGQTHGRRAAQHGRGDYEGNPLCSYVEGLGGVLDNHRLLLVN